MTKAEENILHNLFIKLKNEEKDDSSIKQQLELSDALFDQWNIDYYEALETIKQDFPSYIDITIKGINNDKYDFDYHFDAKISLLEGVIFFLTDIIEGEAKTDFAKNQKKQAEKFLPIFRHYFIALDIDSEKNEWTYKLNTADESIAEAAKEAIIFYSKIHDVNLKFWQGKLIDNPSGTVFSNIGKILNYSIKQLKIKNFQGVKEINIEQIPIDSQWLFLIGENGFGKTTILQAIGIGLFSSEDEGVQLLETGFDKNIISLEYCALGQDKINNIRINRFEKLDHVAFYGPSRLQIQSDQTQNDITKKSTTTYSLFNSDGILLNIEFELLIWFLEKNPRFEAVKKTLLKLIPYLADIQIDVTNRKVLYLEKEPNSHTETYQPVTFKQLASGFRSIIAMVGDMMIRLFRARPDVNDPSELSGIVIIDELDLHWHPKMQREIPTLLSSIFPKVQFIASTHSLVPLLGAPENSVLLKVNRTLEEGITVERVTVDFAALSADVMLRDIFNLEKYMSDPKIKAWERFTELKGLMHFEKDKDKKNAYWDEYERLGDQFHFEL
ncbi:MAG: AAA family ATPase [Spirosomataceae bacterium]